MTAPHTTVNNITGSVEKIVVHCLPPRTVDRIWLGFCLAFGAMSGASAFVLLCVLFNAARTWLFS